MLYNIMLVDDEAEVRQDYPGKEIVIFSGFSEFEYAKQAIRLGVKEYAAAKHSAEKWIGAFVSVRRAKMTAAAPSGCAWKKYCASEQSANK